MTLIEPDRGLASLIERVKNLLIQPRAEWERIEEERTPLPQLLTGYVAPLAIFAAICVFIGLSLFGVGANGVTARVGLVAGLVGAVLQVAIALFWVWAFGLIINALAPTFNAEPDIVRANQLAAYAPTAVLVSSVFMIIPALAPLSALGALYSLLLLYMGLLRLMKAPSDKRLPYFLTVLAIALIAGFVLLAVTTNIRGALGPGSGLFRAAPPPSEATLTLPDGRSIDLSDMEKLAENAAAGAAAPAAPGAALAADQLRALLPDLLPGGLIRTSIETGSTGAMGGVANASGVYESGEQRIRLEVTDMGPLGAFAAMGGMFGAQSSREDADGYERMTTIEGRMTIEEFSRGRDTARYGVVAGNRIMIMADGRNVGPDDVRAAVNAVGVARVETLVARAGQAAAPAAP